MKSISNSVLVFFGIAIVLALVACSPEEQAQIAENVAHSREVRSADAVVPQIPEFKEIVRERRGVNQLPPPRPPHPRL